MSKRKNTPEQNGNQPQRPRRQGVVLRLLLRSEAFNPWITGAYDNP